MTAGTSWTAMATDNRIERTVGLVMLAILAVGCVLVLRPFFTALCFALILVVASWPAFERLQRLLGERRALAASRRAELPHRAPTSGHDVEAPIVPLSWSISNSRQARENSRIRLSCRPADVRR